MACVARRGPLSGMNEIRFEDLPNHPLVMREAGSRTRARVEDAAREAGITLTPAIEAEGREAVREIVATGGGIGFVSQAEFGQDRRLQPVLIRSSSGLVLEDLLICLKDRAEGRLIRAFLDHAKRSGGVVADADDPERIHKI